MGYRSTRKRQRAQVEKGNRGNSSQSVGAGFLETDGTFVLLLCWWAARGDRIKPVIPGCLRWRIDSVKTRKSLLDHSEVANINPKS